MRANECLPDGCIGDNDVAHTVNVAGYVELMSDMKELGEIES